MPTFLSMSLLLALASPAQAGAIDRYVGDEVAVVVHLDLTGLDVDGLLTSALGGVVAPDELGDSLGPARAWLEAMRQAGAEDFYLLINPMDLPGPPVAIVPLAEGADAKAIGRILCGDGEFQAAPNPWPIPWRTCATINGAVFAGTDEALERLRKAEPAGRPEVAEALAEAGESPAQILLVPSDTQRRILEEMVPTLPRELGGGPITTISRGMRWAVFVLEAEPEPTLRLVVEARDAKAAEDLGQFLGGGIALLKQALQAMPAETPGKDELVRGLDQIAPEVSDDRAMVVLEPEVAATVVGGAVQSARQQARRSQSINNLKQIGLALHNYLQRNKDAFPPAAITDSDGKPLLSWRVAILPYIEQKALYDEFHLDEPWDSPHNKALIGRMPPTYRNPMLQGRESDAGKTVYLAPRGEATMFPTSGEGVTIRDVTDGTSNTILVVEADADQAAVWTKPEDWEVGDPIDTEGLFGLYPSGTNFLFADGSVRFLREMIDAKVLRALLTRNGGEVLGPDDY